MSNIDPAGPGEILRAVQKDESYINKMHQNISSLGLEIFGPQTWIKYKSLCEPATRFLYYAVTTLSDYQTLGEEYTGLIQVVHRKNKLPSKFMRLLMIFLQTFGPHLLKYWFKNLQLTVKRNPLQFDKEAVRRISNLLPVLEQMTEYVDKINVCIFYFHGSFYHLAKRLTGISYVKYIGADSKQDTTRGGFRVLGLVATVHLALNILYTFYKNRNIHNQETKENNNSTEDTSDTYIPPKDRCSLCLDKLGSRGITTTTPCGHLYCWTCILESLQRNPECPLCRQPVESNRVVPCRNYH
eukprot:TRINITY_DN9037_c0_g1_i1.p1 TRINITY_DN9037_c0_g1~~TRINITY_DN9037_c0_g1_i1.p1  ORF type:complete len:298 (-),score=42.45 TRINITY_DN9037_c0_g1_i1:98-991(-)